jgi:hypothetical protein
MNPVTILFISALTIPLVGQIAFHTPRTKGARRCDARPSARAVDDVVSRILGHPCTECGTVTPWTLPADYAPASSCSSCGATTVAFHIPTMAASLAAEMELMA